MSLEKKNSYGQILKSSSLVGGSQAVGMILGFVRTKVLAVILGTQAPAAVGLLGLFTTLTQLVNSVAGLGASGSGVREISFAHSSGDEIRFASMLKALRRLLLGLGIISAFLMFGLAPWLSQLSFNNYNQSNNIRLLAITVLLANINSAQSAVFQGRRMLRQLALMGIWSAIIGTLGSIALYFWLGINAVVPSMILLAIIAPIIGWCYSKRISVVEVRQSWEETAEISKKIVTLGITFLSAGLIGIAVTWLVQMQVSRAFGEVGLGQYSAAYRISGFVVGFILAAMMSDFFPRLSAVAGNNQEIVRLVNEQTEIGVLMSLPALIGILCFSEWIIPLLYSTVFAPAVPMFRWLLLGCLGKVCSWPMGMVFGAQGASRKILISELIAACIHLSGVWLGMKYFGLIGASIAFCVLYLVYFVSMFFWLRYLIGFYYTRECLQIMAGLVVFLVLSVSSIFWLPCYGRIIAGTIITAGVSIWSIYTLINRVGITNSMIQKVLNLPILKNIRS